MDVTRTRLLNLTELAYAVKEEIPILNGLIEMGPGVDILKFGLVQCVGIVSSQYNA